MNFSTDKFMRGLWSLLDGIKTDFTNDMVKDGLLVAAQLKEDNNPMQSLAHMNEIGTLAEMATNFQHDCQALFDEFDKRFRYDHGDQKHSATALDAMKIITIIGNDIDSIAPHISYLFESDSNFFPDIFNDSFVTTFEIPAE